MAGNVHRAHAITDPPNMPLGLITFNKNGAPCALRPLKG